MKYIFLIIFAVLIYTEEKINNSEAVASMLSCDTHERSNSPYIKLWNFVFLRTRKRSLLCDFDLEENPEKGLRQWQKYPWVKSKFAHLRVREKKLAVLKWL